MDYKIALGALSFAIGVVAYGIYFWQITKKGGVQPHPFSWFLFGLVTVVAFLAQRQRGAGAGSWVTGLSAVVCLIIGALSLLRHRWRFRGFDWLSLGTGLAVFMFYLVAKDPTSSAILATATDVVGFAPTLKKGWIEPHQDSATSFALNGIKFVPAVFAVQSYSLATCLFPTSLIFVNLAVAAVLVARRQ